MGLTPAFKVSADALDITGLIADRLLSLVIADNAGYKSDTVEIQLDDADHAIALPRTGASLTVWLGYKEESVQKMGVYTVDEVELSGPPNTLIIRGKAADMNKGLKQPKTRTWQKPGTNPPRFPLKEILETIAGENELTPKLGKVFEVLDYAVVNQTNESDLNLLTRLGKTIDAVAKPAGGHLLFVKKGEAKAASGTALPSVSLTRQDVMTWNVTLSERGAYQSVKARYRDKGKSDEITVQAGDTEPTYTIRKIFKDEAEATKAANAKLDDFKRGKSKVSLEMTGNTSMVAEAKLFLSGFRTGVDGAWVAESVTHNFTNDGYSTSVEGTTHLKQD